MNETIECDYCGEGFQPDYLCEDMIMCKCSCSSTMATHLVYLADPDMPVSWWIWLVREKAGESRADGLIKYIKEL
jgi:hypothetical protein